VRNLLLALVLCLHLGALSAQEAFCNQPGIKHEIRSEIFDETREFWVSLPLWYSDTIDYPVVYVLDAEWRFNITRHILFDQGANGLIQQAIVVGIPHVEVENKRGKDLTFSQSRIEYDGEIVDSTRYNSDNSGGAAKFYQYLLTELIPRLNETYPTNGHETLVGHSFGGSFGGYLLSLEHPFEVIHMYDPSIWFSDGEIINRLKGIRNKKKTLVKVHITYQDTPKFHKDKIEELISEFEALDWIQLTKKFYPGFTHNSLFLDSFYQGIKLTNK